MTMHTWWVLTWIMLIHDDALFHPAACCIICIYLFLALSISSCLCSMLVLELVPSTMQHTNMLLSQTSNVRYEATNHDTVVYRLQVFPIACSCINNCPCNGIFDTSILCYSLISSVVPLFRASCYIRHDPIYLSCFTFVD